MCCTCCLYICITSWTATMWLKSNLCVLPGAEKRVGIASTPPFSHHQWLLRSPRNFCVRGCIFCVRREASQLWVSQIEVRYDGRWSGSAKGSFWSSGRLESGEYPRYSTLSTPRLHNNNLETLVFGPLRSEAYSFTESQQNEMDLIEDWCKTGLVALRFSPLPSSNGSISPLDDHEWERLSHHLQSGRATKSNLCGGCLQAEAPRKSIGRQGHR